MSLTIHIPSREIYNEETNEFFNVVGTTLKLEHSLVSISKWEAKWKKPFINQENKTREETIDYIKCMTLTQNVDDMVYNFLTNENLKQINDYISDPMTATWFSEETKRGIRGRNRIVTSELIYYWMIALQIPVEFQKWHLNRLITLIQVCNEEQKQATNGKKIPKREILSRNHAINEARKAALHTKG